MSLAASVALAQAFLSLVGTGVLIWTVLLLRADVALQSKEMDRQSRIWSFEIYQRIDNRVADLVWQRASDPRLKDVYVPLPPTEREALRNAQRSAQQWGAWETLNAEQQLVYAFVRTFLENLEQMFEVREMGGMTDQMWNKWEGWVEVWVDTRYFEFVFEDQRPRLLPGFVELVETVQARLAAMRSGHLANTETIQ